jgi:hypothetical protein
VPDTWCTFHLASGGSPRGRPTPFLYQKAVVTEFSDVPTCSARGCRRVAGWALLWRNPRIHTDDRRKRWLACDEHRATLGDFLLARGFPLETTRLTGQP